MFDIHIDSSLIQKMILLPGDGEVSEDVSDNDEECVPGHDSAHTTVQTSAPGKVLVSLAGRPPPVGHELLGIQEGGRVSHGAHEVVEHCRASWTTPVSNLCVNLGNLNAKL